jgi:hypothetical protein
LSRCTAAHACMRESGAQENDRSHIKAQRQPPGRRAGDQPRQRLLPAAPGLGRQHEADAPDPVPPSRAFSMPCQAMGRLLRSKRREGTSCTRNFHLRPLGHCCAIPCRAAGARMLRDLLAQDGVKAGRLHVATLMKRMGVEGSIADQTPQNRCRGTRFTPTCCRNCPLPGAIRSHFHACKHALPCSGAMDITYIHPLGRLLRNRLPIA